MPLCILYPFFSPGINSPEVSEMKKRIISTWIVFLTLFAVIPVFISGIENHDILNFSNYENRIFKEFKLQNSGTNRYKANGEPRFILNTNLLRLRNWLVKIKSSALRIRHIVDSQCLDVESNYWKKKSGGKESTVLGVRVHFPKTRQNDRALIKPQFRFHVYDRKGRFTNLSNGVVGNVGVIKSISVWVKGRNYPYKFSMRMVDDKFKTREYYFGTLFFNNWRHLTWKNPNYIDKVKDRIIIRKPMYPKDIPYLWFKEFVVYRQMDQLGGDFIMYIKGTTMVYEKYAETIADPDIDDEKIWKIMQKRALKRMEHEQRKLADKADIYRREFGRLKGKKTTTSSTN